MSAINLQGGGSIAALIQSYSTPIVNSAVQKVDSYNQITTDAIAKQNSDSVRGSTQRGIVDLFGQVGLIKGVQIDISA